MAWKTQTGTRHSSDCKMAFGRKDPNCPRCRELLRGDAPRDGYGSAQRRLDADFSRRLREHDCKQSGCGPVCTFGDW